VTAEAWFAGRLARGLTDVQANEALFDALEHGGKWLIVADFEGSIRGWRFAELMDVPLDEGYLSRAAPLDFRASLPTFGPPSSANDPEWQGPERRSWRSSLNQDEYMHAVAKTREYISQGTVYQANICRVLSAPLRQPSHPRGLAYKLAHGNPAPYLSYALVEDPDPQRALWLASASPELYVRLDPHDRGATISSRPIKGTARERTGLTAKDEAENVMITDLVRNDLSPLCLPGTVAVRDFLQVEEHPGLYHLVSTVEGEVPADLARSSEIWRRLFAVTYPPGSVSGAPKSSALRIIAELETHSRGPYCGAIGWIDADNMSAELAVGIRTFWWSETCCGGALHFGTGAGITWGSDPLREWRETELKAERLVALASQGAPS